LLLEVEQTYAQFSNKGTRLIHTVRVDLSLKRNARIPLCYIDVLIHLVPVLMGASRSMFFKLNPI
jgi:hypothetical protein